MRISDKPHTIYAIQCEKTKRIYIGNTTDFELRVHQHFYALQRKGKTSTATGKTLPTEWQKDYDQFGIAAFKVYKIKEGLTFQEAADEEQKLIELYDSRNKEKGYNLARAKRECYDVKIVDGQPPLP